MVESSDINGECGMISQQDLEQAACTSEQWKSSPGIDRVVETTRHA